MLSPTLLTVSVSILAAPKAPPDRCTNLPECELRCPEVSVQSQKTIGKQQVTFCDPVGMEVRWLNDTVKVSEGEVYGEQRSGRWRFWWPNGTIKSEQHFADTGLPHGLQTKWYDNGAKRSEVRYDEGVKHGPFKRWHSNGTKAAEGSYEQGQLTGTSREFHPNGRLAAEAVVNDGEAHWKRFYSSGATGVTGTTRLGEGPEEEPKPIGTWTLWHANKKKMAEIGFNDRGLDGRYQRWGKNGKAIVDESYIDGEPDGDHQRWFLNGTLAERQSYRRGKKHGTYTRNFPSGRIAEEGSYKGGRKDGTWRQFYRDGQLAAQWVYGAKSTRLTRYDQLGNKRLEQRLVKGLADGPSQRFDASVQKRAEGNYRRGQRDGTWRFWGADGKPLAKGDFVAGRRVGAWRYDHPGGGRRWVLLAIKGSGAKGDLRYGIKGENLRACDKLADAGLCWSLIQLSPKGQLRMHVALPSDWRESAQKTCKRDPKAEHCQRDHGDLLLAFETLAKLEAARRIGRPASCFDEGGQPTDCPKLDETLLPASEAGSTETAKNPFDACNDQASCTALCAAWSEDNEPLRSGPATAVKSTWRLACSPSGHEVNFHPNGRIASAGLLSLPHRRAPRAERTGPWSEFDAEGRLVERGVYDTGLKQGVWERFHPNGQLASSVRFRDGMEEGAEKSFHPNGKTAASGAYKNGVRSGIWSFFDERGKPVSRGAFKRGERDGNWVLFDDRGKPEAKGGYKAGRMSGRWLHFTPKGKRRAICTWTPKGELDLQDCKNARNRPMLRGTTIDGVPQGDWTWFYPNGKNKRAGTMRDGERHGTWRFWHRSGRKRAKGRYENGKKVGEWRCWKDNGTPTSCSR